MSSCYASINFDELAKNNEEPAVVFLSNINTFISELGKAVNTFATECNRTRSREEEITDKTKGYREVLTVIQAIRIISEKDFYRNRIRELEKELKKEE